MAIMDFGLGLLIGGGGIVFCVGIAVSAFAITVWMASGGR